MSLCQVYSQKMEDFPEHSFQTARKDKPVSPIETNYKRAKTATAAKTAALEMDYRVHEQKLIEVTERRVEAQKAAALERRQQLKIKEEALRQQQAEEEERERKAISIARRKQMDTGCILYVKEQMRMDRAEKAMRTSTWKLAQTAPVPAPTPNRREDEFLSYVRHTNTTVRAPPRTAAEPNGFYDELLRRAEEKLPRLKIQETKEEDFSFTKLCAKVEARKRQLERPMTAGVNLFKYNSPF